MADRVTTRILQKGSKRYVIQLTNESDGTGESAVKKVDLTNLLLQDGVTSPDYLVIDKIIYNVSGFNYVTLFWDRQPSDEVAAVLFGQGSFDYIPYGGLTDPKSDQDGTGNLILTTDGAANGDGYQIIIELRLGQIRP